MDFTQILADLHLMRLKLQMIIELVEEAEKGNYNSPHLGARTFTSTEKASLLTQYNTLKAEAVTLFQKLP